MPVEADEALQLLYRHKTRIVASIAATLGDIHAAEDVFQEVAVLVVRKAGEIDTVDAVPAWARGAARLIGYKVLRDRKRSHRQLDAGILDQLEDDWRRLEEGGAAEHRLVALRACMARLPPDARRLIAERYEQGRSGEELARRLGKSLNAVYVAMSRIHRALAACVRRRIAAQGGGDG